MCDVYFEQMVFCSNIEGLSISICAVMKTINFYCWDIFVMHQEMPGDYEQHQN